MRKILVILLCIFVIIPAVFFAGILYIKVTQPKKVSNPQQTIIPTSSVSPSDTILTTPQPTPTTVTVNIKLCYPAQMIPKGYIQAKNITTNQVLEKEYKGSDVEQTQNVEMFLPLGEYVFRYKPNMENADNTLYGYHTNVCSTGSEDTCKGENKRENIQVNLNLIETISTINLCDYYYEAQNEPIF